MAVIDIFTTDKKYDIIYADPPWQYNDKRGGSARWGAVGYNTMSVNDIAKLPVYSITNKDSALFLWVTMPFLDKAFEIIKAWGFKYKTCAFCWVKTNPKSGSIYSGMGHWTNSNAELCLLATRGHPKRNRRDVKQIVLAPVGRHSAKPADVRSRIEALAGGGQHDRTLRERASRRMGLLGERGLRRNQCVRKQFGVAARKRARTAGIFSAT